MPSRIVSACSLTEERVASSSARVEMHARKDSLPPLQRLSVHRLRAAFANSANTSGSFLSERSNTSSADLQGRGLAGLLRGSFPRLEQRTASTPTAISISTAAQSPPPALLYTWRSCPQYSGGLFSEFGNVTITGENTVVNATADAPTTHHRRRGEKRDIVIEDCLSEPTARMADIQAMMGLATA